MAANPGYNRALVASLARKFEHDRRGRRQNVPIAFAAALKLAAFRSRRSAALPKCVTISNDRLRSSLYGLHLISGNPVKLRIPG
jgi:hypothetical protein